MSGEIMRRLRALRLAPMLALAPFTAALSGQAAPTREETRAALRNAVAFFREKVAVRGGYLWRYSADLSKREGEGKVGESTAWVQPPGTPFVGEALVDAYELSGERLCLDAARESAMALVAAQLRSGGWPYRIEFDQAARRRFAYRVDGRPSRKARNVSVLDDDTTQSALRFLMKYDRATRFGDAVVHEAALYGLKSLLGAQFPNGAWSQVYREPVDRDKYPVKRACYREDGKYARLKAYWEFYTLNDNLVRDVIETLFLAARLYGEERCRRAAMKGGDFLILAQMPGPQPGWAQQYDFDMHPCWARKFEPASITGGESQGVMMTLLDLYERTGERRYLEPIPRALTYYRRSLLPGGKLARFYELKTNRPLYFTRDYKLTYSDKDVPTHYSFTVGSRLDKIERRYRELASRKWRPPVEEELPSRPSAKEVQRMIDAMDERGAWVEKGRLRYWGKSDPTRRVIDPRTFAENIRALARYSRADQPGWRGR